MQRPYRSIHPWTLLCAIVAVASVRAGADTTLTADLDGDGRSERITLSPRTEPTISISRSGRRIAGAVPRRMHPWKLVLGDVDGDGLPDLLVGVRKPTRFFPTPHAGLFVYRFDGKAIVKKWLGSHLADPLVDFVVARGPGGGRVALVALERRRGGLLGLTVYSWIGFGFDADRQVGAWRKARLLSGGVGKVTVEVGGKVRVVPIE